MQQYLFRGKRKNNNDWVYGNLVNSLFVMREDKSAICYIVPDAKLNSNVPYYDSWEDVAEWIEDYEVIPDTVGMWTGLKDKKGVEIYEGDILKSFSFSVPSYEVFNDRGCYRLRYKLKSGDWYDWGPLFRMEEIQWEGRLPLCPDVIGNIHEHPHLLNPAKGAVTNTMFTDPNNAQAAPANQEAIAEQAAAGQEQATEQEAQEKALESEEEGNTEG